MRRRCTVAAASLMWALAGCNGNSSPVGGSGFIEATKVVVSAEVSGRLLALYYSEGDVIANGAAIGVVDSASVHLRHVQATARRRAAVTQRELASIAIRQAEQDVALADKEFTRIDGLLKKGSANQQQFDRADNALKQARLSKQRAQASYAAADADIGQIDAEIGLLAIQLENCTPQAPVSGVIVNKFVEPGELLSPGRAIIEIAKMDTVWVKVYLPAPELSSVRIGGTMDVDPEDGTSTPAKGRIGWISEEAEFTPKNVQTQQARADLVYAVKVFIPNREGVFKIGMPVAVRLPGTP